MGCALALLLLSIQSSAPHETWEVSAYGRPTVMDGVVRPVTGLRALYRGPVLIGGELDYSTMSGEADQVHLAGTCGMSFELAPRVRLDLLGEMGLHFVLGTATAPFLGAQPSVEFLVSDRFALGIGLSARYDILDAQVDRLSWGGNLHAGVRFH